MTFHEDMSPAAVRQRGSRTLPALSASVALLAVLGLTGCASLSRQLTDRWAITYLVELDGPVGTSIGPVEVHGTVDDVGAGAVHDLGGQTTTLPVGTGSAWTEDVTVVAEERAAVRVDPPAGVRATCHVLVDGEREIATATATAPGQPVSCAATTPRFPG